MNRENPGLKAHLLETGAVESLSSIHIAPFTIIWLGRRLGQDGVGFLIELLLDTSFWETAGEYYIWELHILGLIDDFEQELELDPNAPSAHAMYGQTVVLFLRILIFVLYLSPWHTWLADGGNETELDERTKQAEPFHEADN